MIRRATALIFALLLGLSLFRGSARADMSEPVNTGQVPSNQLPANLHRVSLDQRLGSQVPLDLRFQDELGHSVRLSQIFRDKPVLLTLAYFKCPGLCTFVLNGVVEAIRSIPQKLGRDFQVLTVSIDPNESWHLARMKKRSYLARYGITAPSDDAPGWRMLTGDEPSIRKLADSVGFHYVYDRAHDTYSHPSTLMILTPQGKLSQYLLGIDYSPNDLSRAIDRASSSGIGTKIKGVLLYCFRYDPATGTYSFVILKVFKLLGALTVLGIIALVASGWAKGSTT